MKIYTKTGDGGSTSLFAGKRVDKDSYRVIAYGEVDELNSLLGVIITETKLVDLIRKLNRIQNELFVLESDLATRLDIKIKVPRVTKVYIVRLEKEIDQWGKNLPKLKNFILPGGSQTSAQLHLARTVTRRAERSIVTLSKQEKINPFTLSYINRLSDWFFVLARYISMEEKTEEIIWKGRSH